MNKLNHYYPLRILKYSSIDITIIKLLRMIFFSQTFFVPKLIALARRKIQMKIVRSDMAFPTVEHRYEQAFNLSQ